MILVTGNLGYIGSVLTPLLLKQGYDVKGFDTGWFKEEMFLSSSTQKNSLYNRWARVQLIRDIRSIQPDDLEGVSAVIHLAALSNDPLGELNPQLTHEINYKSTVELAKLCKQKKIERFIFSSSCSVYGRASVSDMLRESDLAKPATEYAKSKFMAEQGLLELSSDGFHPIILRNATVYGYSPRMRLDLVVNDLVAKSFLEHRVSILSDGSPWRPLIHIEDLCEAFISFLKTPTPEVNYSIFNIGSNDQNFTIGEIGQEIVSFDPKSHFEILNQAEPDQRSYRVDFSKFQKKFNFKPKWTLRMGIEDLYNKYLACGLTKQNVETKKYVRLQKVKRLLQQKVISEILS